MAGESDPGLLEDYFGNLAPAWVPDTPTDDGIPVTVVPVPKLYGDALFGKYRGVRIDQGSPNWLQLALYSQRTGAPVRIEIGSYSTTPTVDVRYRESSGYDPRIYVPDDGDTPYLASDGLSVTIPVPIELRNNPGVFEAQVRIVDANAVERNRSGFSVMVDRGLWLADGTAPNSSKGPPTCDEIRTAMRDHPGANRLLQNYAWDGGEIGLSIVSAVQVYNQTYPVGGCTFTTITWPAAWRRQLLDGCIAYLMETVAEYMRRGHLPYSAGGLNIDDLGKEQDYTKSADAYRERFAKWCRLVKTRMSIDEGWSSIGSAPFAGYSW